MPCRETLPALEQLRDEYPDERFEVVSVSLDQDPRDAMALLSMLDIDMPVLSDPASSLVELYGIDLLPAGFLIDPEGVIQFEHQGIEAASLDAMKDKLAVLLK